MAIALNEHGGVRPVGAVIAFFCNNRDKTDKGAASRAAHAALGEPFVMT